MQTTPSIHRRQFLQTTAGAAVLVASTRELNSTMASQVEANDWVALSAGYDLPHWFESQRVHLHTRLTRNATNLGRKVAAAVREMGARVYTRHVKSGDYGPFWPTQHGKPYELAAERNFVAEMIEDAHQHDVKLLGYYWITTDLAAAIEHPEWLCRTADGKTIDASRHGNFLCLSSAYRDLVQARLLELVDMGIDGIYFDYRHMPPGGCWCDTCRELFKKQTGGQLPKTGRTDEVEFARHIAFTNGLIEQAFLQWRAAVHERRHDCVMVVSGSNYASTHTTHMSTQIFHLMDSNKTEFLRPIAYDSHLIKKYPDLRMPQRDAKLALGFQLCRDAADGRPAHVWLPFMKQADRAVWGTAGIVAHGCIAAIDVAEKNFPDEVLKPAIALAQRVSPYLSGTKPVRWAAVHFCERARRQLATGPRWDRAMWTHSTSRSFGAFFTLLRERLPTGIITDSQLEHEMLDEVELLFLPNPDALTPRMTQVVDRFRGRGGQVIQPQENWNFYLESEFQKSCQALRSQVIQYAGRSPLRVVGGATVMHANLYKSEDHLRRVVTLVNDFQWVEDKPVEAEDVVVESSTDIAEVANTQVDQADVSPVQEMPEIAPCRDVSLRMKLESKPRRIFDAVTGTEIAATVIDGEYQIVVPEFTALSVIVVEL